jgi:sugar lactone lactonase YvrE
MKTRILIGVSLIVVIVAMANLFPGHAQQAAEPVQPAGNGAPPLSNPLKVALLKWYPANVVPTTFNVGSQPYGLAFDGANLWVANSGDNTVTKLRTSDGETLGTFPAGNSPQGIAFDGANVWVTDFFGNTVTELRCSDGKTLGTFNVGRSPYYPAFDGANIWVPNGGDGTVTKLRASDGKNLGTFNTGGSIAVAFDGTYVWVSTHATSVVRLRQDGSNAGTFAVGRGPLGIAYDGANIWVANNADGTVTKLRASDGATLGTFTVPGGTPYAIAFDGVNIYVTSGVAVLKLRDSDGKVLGHYNISPTWIAFDGANMWTASTAFNFITKF